MGVPIGDIVKAREISLDDLFDKRVAVDAYNWVYQFLTIIRQKDGEPLKDSHGSITSHLSGLFYRNIKLLEAGIKLIYIFDGEPPKIKEETNKKRRDVRAEAKREWDEALKRKDYDEARKQAQRSAKITGDIVEDSKALLGAMGIPVVQAPSEGEAVCSRMVSEGEAFAAATQDYDALLYGCPKIVKNLSISGRRKRGNDYVTVNPEIIELSEVLRDLGLDQEQLITLAILVGTDYNPGGVSGIGPKKALDLVREKKTFEAVFQDIIWDSDVPAQDIFDHFVHPKQAVYRVQFREMNEREIKKILCDEHDFSEDRISSALEKYSEQKRTGQKSLSKWFE